MEGEMGLSTMAIGLKLLIYLSTLGAGGICLSVASGVIEQPSARKWLSGATFIGMMAFLLAIGRFLLSGFQLGDWSLLPMVWELQRASILATGVGVLLVAISSRSPFLAERLLAFGAALSLACSFGLTGHTRGLEVPSFWPYLAMGHTFIAGFWMMAPAILWPRTMIADDILSSRVQRFGEIAVLAIPVLFISGSFVALHLGGGVEGLLASNYGRALAIKLAAALAILAIGAFNKLKVAHAFETEPETARRYLRVTLSLDAALFIIALVAIAFATTVFGPSS